MINTDISIFDGWTDEAFRVWLAGFFDGEGCIYIPKGPGIEITVASTTREVIEAIHQRAGIGAVNTVTFSNENWKTKYAWRVRRYGEAEILLGWIRPHLTIKATQADEALALVSGKLSKTRERHQLHREVVALVDSGVPRSEVAERFGLQRKMVDWVYRYSPVVLNRERAGTVPGQPASFVQSHHKDLVAVTTKTTPSQRRWSLMTPDRVRAIRERLAADDDPKRIAPDFGVSPQTIRDIARGKTWKNVT